MARISLEIKGKLGSISLHSLQSTLGNVEHILAELDRAISRNPNGTLDWKVIGLSTGSLIVEVASESRVEGADFGPRVAGTYVRGMQSIEVEGLSPEYLSPQGMAYAKKLIKTIGHNGAAGLKISTPGQEVELTAQASVNIDQLLKPGWKSIGSIEGRLDTISFHRAKPNFVVYYSITHKAVKCVVNAEMLSRGKDLLGRRVNVFGTVHYNARGEPVRVEAEGIRSLRSRDELPTLDDIGGIDPDFTGELTSEEFLRRMRNG